MGQGEPRAWQMSAKSLTACVGERRRPVTVFVVLPLVLLAALLLCCKPALALSQRGHVFSFSFGSEGKAEGQFAHPSGIAVNDSTGDVYVADRYNDRVEEFKPETVAGKLVGENYAAEFAVPDAEDVAVDDSCYVNGKSGAECASLDPSNGDVYVVGARSVRNTSELDQEATQLKATEAELKTEAKQLKAEAKQLDKEAEKLTGTAQQAKEKEAKESEAREAQVLSEAEGAKEAAAEDLQRAKEAEKKLLPGEETEEEEEVKEEAGDPEHFWVYKFGPEGKPITTIHAFTKGKTTKAFEEEEEALDGVAVDSSGSLFVYQRDGEIYKFDDAADANQSVSLLQSRLTEEAKPGLAVDSEGNLYVGVTSEGEELEGLPELEGFNEEAFHELEKETAKLRAEAKQLREEAAALTGPAREEDEEDARALLAKAQQASATETTDEEREAQLEGLEEGFAEIVAEYDGRTGEEFAAAAKLEGTTGKVLDPALDFEDATALAVNSKDEETADDVDELNDVYLDNVSVAGGERTGTVSAFSPAGSLIQRFSTPRLEDPDGVAVDALTGAVYVADAKADDVDVFELEEPGAPTIEPGSVSSSHVTSSSGELKVTIDPSDPQDETSYYLEYGTVACTTPSSCTKAAGSPARGEGFSDEPVSLELGALSASTTYHFRAIAENAHGSVASEERTFTTRPSTGETPPAGLPDHRAWEQVSPAHKHGATVLDSYVGEGGLTQAAADGSAIAYIASGPIGENEPAGARAPEATQIVSERVSTPEGPRWSSEDVMTESEGPARGFALGIPIAYQFFSSDLETALVNPYDPFDVEQHLSSETAEKTMYLRSDATCADTPQTCYAALLSAANDTAETKVGEAQLAFEGATPDLDAVVFHSHEPLTAGASGPGLYEWFKRKPAAEQLQLLNLLPTAEGGGWAPSATLGARGSAQARSGAISDNGLRVVWSGSGHLYLRDLEPTTPETLRVDEPDKGASGLGSANPIFQAASANESKVFFTDSQRLTKDSTGQDGTQDLYVFELAKPVGERVTDLGPDIDEGTGAAAVQGALLGASEDGSFVYFVANGILAPGAEPGHCTTSTPEGAAGCNLYVAHFDGERWEAPRFIARLSEEDAPDWGTTIPQPNAAEYSVQNLTARVSPNGEWLAFMSNRSLTGYDNIDANESTGAHADEEVYLYHYTASPGDLVCASCDPSGAQPIGVLDYVDAGEGEGLLVDQVGTWAAGPDGETQPGIDSWLAASLPGWTGSGKQSYGALYQSRYLSDDGRLFFDGADALVPLAKPTRKETIDGKEEDVGLEHVYEYEPTGVGGCERENTEGGCVAPISGESEQESAFLDASENGDDVFFLTSAKLSPTDIDTTFDAYDARVCTRAPGPEQCPSPPSSPTPPCSEEGCRSAPSPSDTHEPPAGTTLTASGPGNVVPTGNTLAAKSKRPAAKAPTRAQQLAAALKTCRKDRNKRKRSVCERQARKRYGDSSKRASKDKRSSTTRNSVGTAPASRTRG